MSAQPKFSEGDKLLCYHGPLIYEAKCLKSAVTRGRYVRYYIHYAGWNKSWDEWVTETRVMTLNNANLKRKEEVEKAHMELLAATKKNKSRKTKATPAVAEAPAKRPRTRSAKAVAGNEVKVTPKRGKSKGSRVRSVSTPAKPATTSAAAKKPKAKKPKAMPARSRSSQPQANPTRFEGGPLDPEDPYLPTEDFSAQVPPELQSWLVEDWNIVTKQHKLVILPARLNVSQILDNYVLHKKSSNDNDLATDSTLLDIADSIKELFNILLGSQLLYRFEKAQYYETMDNYPGTPMAHMYGGVHLLRMFANIGPMLECAGKKGKALLQFLMYVPDILKFMVTYRRTFFDWIDYKMPKPEYRKKYFRRVNRI